MWSTFCLPTIRSLFWINLAEHFLSVSLTLKRGKAKASPRVTIEYVVVPQPTQILCSIAVGVLRFNFHFQRACCPDAQQQLHLGCESAYVVHCDWQVWVHNLISGFMPAFFTSETCQKRSVPSWACTHVSASKSQQARNEITAWIHHEWSARLIAVFMHAGVLHQRPPNG